MVVIPSPLDVGVCLSLSSRMMEVIPSPLDPLDLSFSSRLMEVISCPLDVGVCLCVCFDRSFFLPITETQQREKSYPLTGPAFSLFVFFFPRRSLQSARTTTDRAADKEDLARRTARA